MTTTVRIPGPDEMREVLEGLGGLLKARTWERAAIVYAYTEVQTGRRNGRKPQYPKLNIRRFAALGIAGLSTNKAVERYRGAWEIAVANGWAAEVDPGDIVELPVNKPFPSWPHSREHTTKPVEERVLDGLERATASLRRIDQTLADELTDEARDELAERLAVLRDEADMALRVIQRAAPVGLEPGE